LNISSAKQGIFLANKDLEDLILKNVVIHYIQTPEPMGSLQLKDILGLSVSPATIRNYLKKLVAQGYLEQIHSSSGRIPTSQAFKEFWVEHFRQFQEFSIEDLEDVKKASDFFGIYTVLSKNESFFLENIYEIKEKFLVLDFGKEQICIKRDPHIRAFLNEFLGYECLELLKLAYENMIVGLLEKLHIVLRHNIKTFNTKELICLTNQNKSWSKSNFESFFDGSIINILNDGVYFEHFVPKDYLLVKTKVFLGEKPMSMLALGHISRDFGRFFNSL